MRGMLIDKKHALSGSFSLAFCFLALLFSACSLFGDGNPTLPKHPVKAPLSKQIYTVPEVGIFDFDTLDPAQAHDSASLSAVQMIYTGLVQLDDTLNVKPQLAQSWQQGSDGTTWTFHLKSDLKFSDGTALTSHDVAYSIDRALQPATKSTVAPIYLRLIKDSDKLLAGRINTLIDDSILTPDAQTLTLLTSKQAAYFLSMLAYPCSYVVEKSLIEKYATKFTDHLREGGGAGPFKVSQYTHRSTLDLVPNPNYYNQQPQLQKVTFTFFHSPDEAYQAYQDHKIDMTGVPITTFASDRKRSDFVQVPQLWINYYAMNYLTKPFDNLHIRQAFALAIDKTALLRDVWKDTLLPTNHIVPQGMNGYNPDLVGPDGTKTLSGNPKLAQQLLQQGLEEEKWTSVTDMPAIHLTYASGVASFEQEVKELIAMWQKVLHVQVLASPVDYDTLLDKVTAATNNPQGIQFWGLSWVGEYPDAQDWLTQQFGKGMVYNNMNYGENTSSTAAQQQGIQQQLEQADANRQESERLSSYQEAEQKLVQAVAWIPIAQVTSPFLRTPAIVNIKDNAQSIIPPDDWANIYRVQ
jgi:peptide/nickel transport system substrate-binding protein/oligopeptide transport system substrate-binding protein